MNGEPFHIPTALQKKMPPGLQSAFAKVDFAELTWVAELAALSLGKDEAVRFGQFKYPKRQKEWLAGRLAAKFAILSFLAQAGNTADLYPQFQIINDSDGRPEFLPPDNNPEKLVAISISHSHGLAVAMACNSPACGIDIQLKTDTLLRVREKFISPAELDILLAGGENLASVSGTIKLALLWSAKEAIRKKHGRQPLPGFMQISLISKKDIDGQGKVLNFKVVGARDMQQVFAFMDQDYSCAYCV